jgi:hypothetical protein
MTYGIVYKISLIQSAIIFIIITILILFYRFQVSKLPLKRFINSSYL